MIMGLQLWPINNDCVMIFSVNMNAKKSLTIRGKQYVYLLPHGVSLSKDVDLMALTNYGDNSVMMQPLSEALDTTVGGAVKVQRSSLTSGKLVDTQIRINS